MIRSFSSSDSNEEANLCLMENDNDTEYQVSVSNCNNGFVDMHNAFLELIDESERLNTTYEKLKEEFKELQLKYVNMICLAFYSSIIHMEFCLRLALDKFYFEGKRLC